MPSRFPSGLGWSANPPWRKWEDLDLEAVARIAKVTPELEQQVPASVRDLDGNYVHVRGFMNVAYSIENATWFIIARNKDCQYGRDAVWHFVEVRLREGQETTYEDRRLVELHGWLRVEVVILDDEVVDLYHLDDAVVVK